MKTIMNITAWPVAVVAAAFLKTWLCVYPEAP